MEQNDPKLVQQLEDLQARYAFQEDLLHALNKLVSEQQRDIDQLTKQFVDLKSVLDEVLADMASMQPDERPPHY